MQQMTVNNQIGYFLTDDDYGRLLQAQQSLQILCSMLYSLHQSPIVLNTEQLGSMIDYPASALSEVMNHLE